MSFQVKRVSVEPWKKEAITYSIVLKGFWRKRQSMESKSTLLSGTFHSLWTGSLFEEKNSLFTGYKFQHSCVITNNCTGQNNLRGAIKLMEVCTFSRSKWNTLFPLSHHWLTTHNARGRDPFLSPTLARASPSAYHLRVTPCGYLKLTELAHRLRFRWGISHKSLCFVDASLVLMVSISHWRGCGGGDCAIEKAEELSNYLILAQGKLASPPLANFRIGKIDPGWTSYKNIGNIDWAKR